MEAGVLNLICLHNLKFENHFKNWQFILISAHQLNSELKVPELRNLVSETLLRNKEDYQPFLSLDDKGYEDYCAKMATTPKWGGQVEITALSKSLKKPIEVIQADGPLVEVGKEEHSEELPIILTYHRHYYGLGEHYNSVVPLSKDDS